MKSFVIPTFVIIFLAIDEIFANYNDTTIEPDINATTTYFGNGTNENYSPDDSNDTYYDNQYHGDNATLVSDVENMESLVSQQIPTLTTSAMIFVKNNLNTLQDIIITTASYSPLNTVTGSTTTATTPPLISTTLEPSSTTTVTTIIVKSVEDYHKYYKSEIVKTGLGSQYWINDEIMYKADKHHTLSESHRSAATISLSFPFTFYGHEVNQVTIATGGFLYMSEFLHQWLTATQYIAPLMANFDTQIGNNSHIRHWDNGSVFVVWWEDVYLQDEVDGHFSFQVQLYKNGTIIFSYKEIPTLISGVPSHRHPVKIGMSDAYYMDKPTNTEMKQRTIYEYHRVEINMSLITSNTSVIINPLPSCIQMKTCQECVQASKNLDQTCQWCPMLQHCSDGLDRKRQEWMHHGCHKDFLSSEDQCSTYTTWTYTSTRLLTSNIISIIIVATIFFIMMSLIMAWFAYAYRHPSSRSGIWLIEHQPSQIRQRMVNFFTRLRTSLNASKYRVAMQPEVESLAQM